MLTRCPLKPRTVETLAAIRAYINTLRGLCLKNWSELGKPDGTALVGVLREKWDADLKAANGTAAKAQRKVLAQGLELASLQAAQVRTNAQLRLVNEERDELKKILKECAPTIHAHWLRAKRLRRKDEAPESDPWWCSTCGAIHAPLAHVREQRRLATDIPQTHETHGD